VSGHFGDGVWPHVKRQKREEEQLPMVFVDNCTPPPLRPGQRRRMDQMCDCRPAPRPHCEPHLEAGVDGDVLRCRLVAV